MTTDKVREFKTTGIGSLPHHNIDSALEYCFQFDLPFLPQIPIRRPKEFMIAQALADLPGLEILSDGTARVDLEKWKKDSPILKEKLTALFQETTTPFDFEPQAEHWGAWQPFLFELQERKIKEAKIQIAGPMTCQWAAPVLKNGESQSIAQYPELASQIFQLVLARSLKMVQKLQSLDIQPILFFDEPGFYAFHPQNPAHQLSLHELKLALNTLRKNGAKVGIHCCSNTHWESLLSLPLDYLSIDVELSLNHLLTHKSEVKDFILRGGFFSLGVIPTGSTGNDSKRSSSTPSQTWIREAGDKIFTLFLDVFEKDVEKTRNFLAQCLYTPACGLALHSPQEAESILALLQELQSLYRNSATTGK